MGRFHQAPRTNSPVDRLAVAVRASPERRGFGAAVPRKRIATEAWLF